ncbi:hypothetical protein ACQ4M3_09630 [Leptolyngbya sp. AN03gr2]|uniref:hypothetical protein n=1 Tax=Leptolyngbya sp. AN03gr2 TaxID=3423364 RepID=UPI003D3121D8
MALGPEKYIDPTLPQLQMIETKIDENIRSSILVTTFDDPIHQSVADRLVQKYKAAGWRDVRFEVVPLTGNNNQTVMRYRFTLLI